jgi:hypothetical protein
MNMFKLKSYYFEKNPSTLLSLMAVFQEQKALKKILTYFTAIFIGQNKMEISGKLDNAK